MKYILILMLTLVMDGCSAGNRVPMNEVKHIRGDDVWGIFGAKKDRFFVMGNRDGEIHIFIDKFGIFSDQEVAVSDNKISAIHVSGLEYSYDRMKWRQIVWDTALSVPILTLNEPGEITDNLVYKGVVFVPQ